MENVIKPAQLDGLVPQEVKVPLTGGGEIIVRPVMFSRFSMMLEAAQPLIDYFEEDYGKQIASAKANGAEQPKSVWGDINVLELIRKLPRSMEQLIKAGVGEDLDLDKLYIDDAIRLTKAVIEVNFDFFMQRVLPTFLKAVDEVSVSLVGPTTHKPLSPTATTSIQ